MYRNINLTAFEAIVSYLAYLPTYLRDFLADL